MTPSRHNLKDLIRDEVRATIQSTLTSVIRDVWELELPVILQKPVFRCPSMDDFIRIALQHTIEELLHDSKPKASRKH